MRADKAFFSTDAVPVDPAGAGRILLPQARRGVASGVMALALSCALHAAPLAALGLGYLTQQPVSAGEEVIDLDLIIADDETPPAPPTEVEALKPDTPDAPSVAAAQAPEKPREDKPEPEEVSEPRQPDSKPEPMLTPAEHKVISVANDAAPQVTSDAAQATLDSRYSARVARHLARFKRFPSGIRGVRTSGRVVIRFSLDAEGRVLELALAKPSGIAAFDNEALAMIRRAEPFPKRGAAGGAALGFAIPVSYRLKD